MGTGHRDELGLDELDVVFRIATDTHDPARWSDAQRVLPRYQDTKRPKPLIAAFRIAVELAKLKSSADIRALSKQQVSTIVDIVVRSYGVTDRMVRRRAAQYDAWLRRQSPIKPIVGMRRFPLLLDFLREWHHEAYEFQLRASVAVGLEEELRKLDTHYFSQRLSWYLQFAPTDPVAYETLSHRSSPPLPFMRAQLDPLFVPLIRLSHDAGRPDLALLVSWSRTYGDFLSRMRTWLNDLAGAVITETYENWPGPKTEAIADMNNLVEAAAMFRARIGAVGCAYVVNAGQRIAWSEEQVSRLRSLRERCLSDMASAVGTGRTTRAARIIAGDSDKDAFALKSAFQDGARDIVLKSVMARDAARGLAGSLAAWEQSLVAEIIGTG